MSDHYKTLQVTRKASSEEIQHAYRTLALRYHPDRNPAPGAAACMTAINEAWEVLGDSRRRRDYDASLAKPAPNGEIVAAILQAARDTVLRGGWRLVEDGSKTLLLENAKQRLRVVLLDRVDSAALSRISRQYPEFCVVLAVGVDGPLQPVPNAAAIDLMHSERHGTPLPDGPSRSLIAVFL